MVCESDLIILGGGPAGLSAAINGSSEGLNVSLLDNGVQLGGQARESSAIENYPGFPEGITGNDLMGALVRQADKFSTHFLCPVAAVDLHRDNSSRFLIITDDGQEYVSRSILISIGLTYRRLGARGISQLMGRGVYYGAPIGKANGNKGFNIAVVGGANSAGQAVVNLAKNKKNNITLLIRKTIDSQMSSYLIERIRKLENVHVCEFCEVTEVSGKYQLEGITYKQTTNGEERAYGIDADYLFIYIGALPRTYWLKRHVEVDKYNFIKTWTDLEPESSKDRTVLPYETSIAGVFAAGDVRYGSVKRIASAAGEGAAALQMIHKYLGATP